MTPQDTGPCMTVQKDAKLFRAMCLQVCMSVEFKVIELFTQLKMSELSLETLVS